MRKLLRKTPDWAILSVMAVACIANWVLLYKVIT